MAKFHTSQPSILATHSRRAGAYFTFLPILFSLSLSMSGLFRFIGAAAATTVHAQAFGSIGILVLILTSGFAILRRESASSCMLRVQLAPACLCA